MFQSHSHGYLGHAQKYLRTLPESESFLLTPTPQEMAPWEKVSWKSVMLTGCFPKIQNADRRERSSFWILHSKKEPGKHVMVNYKVLLLASFPSPLLPSFYPFIGSSV